ncbi:MAG: glycerol dehydrogenase [Christensenellaceae bacterium]|nr:glycerol dehydrogenase [Christensenellaceae bacterium]
MANIIISPSRYVQGSGELKNIAKHTLGLGSKFFILGTTSGLRRVEETVKASFAGTDAALHFEAFNGECSKNEIARLCEKVAANGCDVIVGIGGGKTLDTAKAVAYYQKAPVAIVPTIASTDAPCSALSVIYTDDGVFEEYLFLPSNPNIVLVDTAVVAKAPARLLVAGMGDALATYFEGRAAAAAGADNCAGGKCTKAALALAKLCYETLIAEGFKAALAMQNGVCTKAVEAVIEANTLLSGLGFESAGLAAAHAIHNGLTAIPQTHELYHGEKVAFGTLVQLMLENAPMEEISEVLDFCHTVGLPTCLADLGIREIDPEQLMEVARLASAPGETIHNMPFPVTAEDVYAAILAADSMGHSFDEECDCGCEH